MAQRVAGGLYYEIDGQLAEIKRQLRQPNGYPYDLESLKIALQNTIEGKFGSVPQEKKKKMALAFHEEITVGPLTKLFVPNEFFKTRKGLYLWSDMERVLRGAREVASAPAATLKSFDLKKNVDDREIKAELPERHEVELWQLAALVEAQKDGEDGSLLTNGYANIFYVAGYAVSVRWYAYDREWGVDAWRLDDGRWRADRRVFSAN